MHPSTLQLLAICAIMTIPAIVVASRKGNKEHEFKNKGIVIASLVLLTVGLALLLFFFRQ